MPLLPSLFRRLVPAHQEKPRRGLAVELLEARTAPSVTAVVTNGQLVVTGDAQRNVIQINLDPAQNQIVVENTQQEVAMIEDFAELADSGNAAGRAAYAEASLMTQEYLDALWVAASS